MDRDAAERLVGTYYATFNSRDRAAFVALLTDDVEHAISQGAVETGREAFTRFMAHMDRCYRERIELVTVLSDQSGHHAAAEFMVHGEYLATDPDVPPGTPPARGQRYTVAAGAFFLLRGGKVARVANHYNLGEWVRQIEAG
jgi:steroid delta-isomerase-like uncharacterized protein